MPPAFFSPGTFMTSVLDLHMTHTSHWYSGFLIIMHDIRLHYAFLRKFWFYCFSFPTPYPILLILLLFSHPHHLFFTFISCVCTALPILPLLLLSRHPFQSPSLVPHTHSVVCVLYQCFPSVQSFFLFLFKLRRFHCWNLSFGEFYAVVENIQRVTDFNLLI